MATPTSALSRDAARLRSMMNPGAAQAATPEADPPADHETAQDLSLSPGTLSAEDLDAIDTSARLRRPTMLRMPAAPAGRSLRSLMVDASRSTPAQAREQRPSAPPAVQYAAPQPVATGPAIVKPAAVPRAAVGPVAAQPAAPQPAVPASAAAARVPLAEDVPTVDPVIAAARAHLEAAAQELNPERENAGTRQAPRTIRPDVANTGYNSIERTYAPARSDRQRRSRPVLATIAVLVGTTIGVGLYAGGADLISGIFKGRTEQIASEPSPSAVTERPLPPPPVVQEQAGDSGAVFDVERPTVQEEAPTASAAQPAPAAAPAPAGERSAQHSSASAATASSPAVPSASRATAPRSAATAPRPNASGATAPSGASRSNTSSRVAANTAPARTAPAREETSRPSETQAGSSATVSQETGRADRTSDRSPQAGTERTRTASQAGDAGTSGTASRQQPAAGTRAAAASSGKYLVQVRATPDQAEANLIAKRLKKNGAAGVAIVRSQRKDGSVLYRVRYSATGTSNAAQTAATRAGYKNVWVVPQR